MAKLTFRESEQRCEQTFLHAGKWWHLFTNGKETPVIFTCDDDFRFAINLLARCAVECPLMKIVAFEVMSDHIHIAASGERDNLLAFFRLFRRRLARYFSNRSTPLPDSFQPTLKEIADLRSLRNTIVYINRNGYVVDPSFTPFSYPWGTGRYYYNDIPCVDAVSNYSTRELRTLLKCDTPGVPPDFKIINGHISPTSFCAIKFGMAMFRDAHHYFALLTKNVEAYSELAAELDDGEFLTDAELFTQVWKIVREKYKLERLSDLSKAQKQDLARALHYDWRSSNGQIRRILGLSQYEVDSLFPLSKK